MMYSCRALCLLHILSVIAICTSARSWQEKDIITTKLQVKSASSVIAFTSPHVKHSKKSHHKRVAWPVVHAPEPSNHPETCTTAGCIFDVMTFSAVGDGITDDTKAFQATWRAACHSESSVIVVPAYYVFVVGQITFKGPCKSNLTFQVDGTIIPPIELSVWARLANKVQWIGFYRQVDMTLRGSGVVNGLGEVWWNQPCKVLNISIVAPGGSPNTDGIHLQNTGYALLDNLVIATGDDCISLQTGTTDVVIRNVICGPGHGISIGGLGQGNSQACVSNITVQDVLIQNTQNGIRIKTWQGGSGVVQHVTFDKVFVVNVQNPIVINQFYCDTTECQNDTAAVLVSDISFRNIQGTYDQLHSHAPIYFACSDTVPCRDIKVDNVELLPAEPTLFPSPSYCWNSYGASNPFCYPPLCLLDDPFIEDSEEFFC